MRDKTHYRVANFAGDPFQDGRTSYFHKSIGGYHAAKMCRYQDLIEFQLQKQNIQIFNMLNVKYFIIPVDNGKEEAQQNPDANGNAWFVNEVQYVKTANEEIKALDSLNTKKVAILKDHNSYGLEDSRKYDIDSLATIKLTKYSLNALSYESFSNQNGFAVFFNLHIYRKRFYAISYK